MTDWKKQLWYYWKKGFLLVLGIIIAKFLLGLIRLTILGTALSLSPLFTIVGGNFVFDVVFILSIILAPIVWGFVAEKVNGIVKK